jgi:ATP-dependent Clp protease adaptor protein ClpS
MRFLRTGAGEPVARPIYNGPMSDKNPPNPMIDDDSGNDLALAEARPKLKKPPLYRVVLINDDYTPMEFVVEVLESIFGMERNSATRVMLEVHTKGKGICGVFSYEIAETKVAQVTSTAQQQQHPLLCTMEES